MKYNIKLILAVFVALPILGIVAWMALGEKDRRPVLKQRTVQFVYTLPDGVQHLNQAEIIGTFYDEERGQYITSDRTQFCFQSFDPKLTDEPTQPRSFSCNQTMSVGYTFILNARVQVPSNGPKDAEQWALSRTSNTDGNVGTCTQYGTFVAIIDGRSIPGVLAIDHHGKCNIAFTVI